MRDRSPAAFAILTDRRTLYGTTPAPPLCSRIGAVTIVRPTAPNLGGAPIVPRLNHSFASGQSTASPRATVGFVLVSCPAILFGVLRVRQYNRRSSDTRHKRGELEHTLWHLSP